MSGTQVYGRPRRFVSLVVVLENRSQVESEGTLRVYRVKKSGEDSPEQSLFYERPVVVPRQGRRVETVYYYCQENEPKNRLCVAFAPTNGLAPAPVYPPFALFGRQISALLLSSRTVSAGLAKRPFEGAVVAAPLLPFPVVTTPAVPEALPDHFGGYGAFDAVVVYDLDADDLPPAKAQALLDFVSAGGDLIVAFSGRSQLPPALLAALPVTRTGTPARRRIDGIRALSPRFASSWTRSDEAVLADRVQPKPGAAVLAGSSQAPLVVRGRYGAGWVTYLTFPFEAGPVMGRGEAIRSLGANLLRPPREDPEWGVDIPPAPPLEEALLNLSEGIETLEPPSAWIVVPLLLLYVALVAPLNFLVLSRLKRLSVAQIVAGVVAVAFGVVFYAIGLVSKGRDALTTQIAVVELPAVEQGQARVDTITGYFSTDRGLASATAPEGALVGPLASGKDTNREGRVVAGADGIRLEGLTLDTWALRRFRSVRLAALGHIEAQLSMSADGALSGTIANRTNLPLEDAVLIFPHSLVNLQTLAPDTKKQVSLTIPRPQRSPSIPPLVKRILRDARGRYSVHYGEGAGLTMGKSAYDGRIERRVLATLRRRLARVPRQAGALPALLVAVANRDPGGVTIESGGQRVLERMLVLHEVSVEAPTGQRHTIASLEPDVLHHDARWLPTSGKTGTPPILEGYGPKTPSVVTFRWHLPASVDGPVKPDRLTVLWKIQPFPFGKDEAKVVLLEGWNFRLRRWVGLADLARVEIKEDGSGYWRPPSEDRIVQDLVHSGSGAVFLRLRNVWHKNLTVEQIRLDVSFQR